MSLQLTTQETLMAYGICVEQLPIIEHIWDNRNVKNAFSVRLNKLSSSKITRQANFSIEYNGNQYSLDCLISSLLGLKFKDCGVKIVGCGQDMFSATLYELINRCRDVMRSLGKLYTLDSKKDAAWYYKFESHI